MEVTEILALIVILITLVEILIKLHPDFIWLLKCRFLDIYCAISSKCGAEIFEEIYFRLKSKNHKYGKVYLLLQPLYILTDNELMKSVFLTDFLHFQNRCIYFNKKYGVMDENLLNAFYDEWKFARAKFTPAFTPSKMKKAIEYINICSQQMMLAINSKLITKKGAEVDIRELAVKHFSNISSAFVLGLKSNSFHDEQNLKFEKHASKLFTDKSLWRNCKLFLGEVFPELATELGIVFTPKKTADLFLNLLDEIITYRQQNNVPNDDVLKLMIDLKNKGDMTMEEITGQCLSFYIANFESSSVTFSYCLYELSKNQTIQDKLRDEINRAYEINGELTYETISTLEYLGRVLAETLRKYPPVHTITRRCTKDYNIPNSNELIEKGTPILIPVIGLHHDPEYYPDPHKFDPDRFLPEVAESRPQFTYLPFGAGPRNCIGTRLAKMQLKLALSWVLKNFKFSLSANTIEPLTFLPFTVVLTVKHKMLLKVEKI